MGCCQGGGSWACGMSDGVSGRSVTASQRCRPLSSRRDMCGGLPLPPPCLGIYGFVEAWRGAEARPVVGGFDVSLPAPAGFPPCAIQGEIGRALRGSGDSGSCAEGCGVWPPSLCWLALGTSGREPPGALSSANLCLCAFPASLPLPTQVPLPGVPGALEKSHLPSQPWRLCHLLLAGLLWHPCSIQAPSWSLLTSRTIIWYLSPSDHELEGREPTFLHLEPLTFTP